MWNRLAPSRCANVQTLKNAINIQRGPGIEAEHADIHNLEWLKYEKFSHNEWIQHICDIFNNNDPAVLIESLTYFGGRSHLQENAEEKQLFFTPDCYSWDLFDDEIKASYSTASKK